MFQFLAFFFFMFNIKYINVLCYTITITAITQFIYNTSNYIRENSRLLRVIIYLLIRDP